MRQHLSPVLYGHHGSGAYHEMMETYKALHAGSAGQLDPDLERRFFGFLSFVKPYEGTFWRAGAYVPHVRFYDEREWRYVPALETDELFLEKDNYLDDKRRDEANKRIAADYRLRFSPEDIRYIIVGSDEEILPMVDAVLHIKGRNYTYDDLRLLTTRIISATQIKEDF